MVTGHVSLTATIQVPRNPIDNLQPKLQAAARAFVSLAVEVPTVKGTGWMVASGFVVDVSDQWMWVTAGHVISELDQVLEDHPDSRWLFEPMAELRNGEVQFSYRTADRTTAERLADNTLSAKPRSEEQTSFLHKMRELDIGLVQISTLYRENLRKVGLRPFSLEQVTWPIAVDPEELENADLETYLLGVPASNLKFQPNRKARATFKALPVWASQPEGPLYEFDPLWPDELHQGSVGGMSGGPIVGFGLANPRLIAVQSSEIILGERVIRLKAWDAANLLCFVGSAIEDRTAALEVP